MADAGESATFGEIVDRARTSLNDWPGGLRKTPRWADEDLLRFAQDGLAALEKARPAVRYDGLRLRERERHEIPQGLEADALAAERNRPVGLDAHFHEALVEYIAYKALQTDENDASPAYRSNMHRKRFEELSQS